jgi:peptidoglycan/xylan/chitin deacetylase (PgdA/CDA1 family)
MLRSMATGTLAGAAAYIAYQAFFPSAQRWGRGFHRGPRGRQQVALTFDDGPSESTEAILEALRRQQVEATFFFCGQNVERLPEIARRVRQFGHEIGNHSYSHPYLLALGAPRVRAEVESAQRAIEAATGVSPRLFRPPYGLRAPSLGRALASLHLTAVSWTVIGNDWKLDAGRIADRVIRGVDDGAIICLHDGDRIRPHANRHETARALDRIIPALRQRGFSFVTAGQMREEWACESSGNRRPAGAGNPLPQEIGDRKR